MPVLLEVLRQMDPWKEVKTRPALDEIVEMLIEATAQRWIDILRAWDQHNTLSTSLPQTVKYGRSGSTNCTGNDKRAVRNYPTIVKFPVNF